MPPETTTQKSAKTDRNRLPLVDYGKMGAAGEVISVESFRHFLGTNCQFSSLRKALAYQGWNCSEEVSYHLSE
ncbi:MAG: hypothetical protein WED04_10020 [Promethearchaeati archaeon SRVP18_Atabeyarchaeia-1]